MVVSLPWRNPVRCFHGKKEVKPKYLFRFSGFPLIMSANLNNLRTDFRLEIFFFSLFVQHYLH